MLGSWVQGDIAIEVYKRKLMVMGKRALTEESLAEELVHAAKHSPRRAPNGVRLTHWSGFETFRDYIAETCGTGRSVPILILSPDGDPIV